MSSFFPWLATLAMLSTGDPKTPQNLDFEEGELGQTPAKWFVPEPASNSGYKVVLSDSKPKAGKKCAVVSREGRDQPQGFGNLMQTIDASKFRGRRVKFSAWVKAEVAGEGNQAMLWLRVDRKDDQPGFFDNMADRPIKTNEWTEYEIVGDVADDAQAISIGLMLLGNGKAWIDAASFAEAGKVGEGNEPAKALTDRGRQNLIAFARLYGYVRYFHPSDEAAAVKWDRFAIDGIAAVEAAKNAEELAASLQKLFLPIATSVKVFVTGQAKTEPLPKGTKTVAWIHHGVGMSKHQIYYSKRIDSKDPMLEARDKRPALKFPDPDQPLFADLGGGVSCTVPLALPADATGTLPKATAKAAPSAKPAGFAPSGNDRATRLADVIIVWNVFQHFYPYMDAVFVDWPAELPKALTAAATDKDELEFHKTLKRLVAALKDGHGGVYFTAHSGGFVSAPIAWDWIEDKLVITKAPPSLAEELKPGFVVVKIDGRPAKEALEEQESLISGATPQWKRHNALRTLLHGKPNSVLALEVQRRPGVLKAVRVVRDLEGLEEGDFHETRPAKIEEIEPGVWYVDIDRISNKDFTDAIPKLEKATGIVFDLRGYPKSGFHGIDRLIDKPVTCAQWHIPLTLRPDRDGQVFQFSNWNVMPAKPKFTAKIAYLTGGGAISAAETYMGIIEHYKLGAIVGGPTAGTNGNVNPFTLPGGYSVSWTGMKVLKHDGSRHHGVGIQPTVPVKRTIAGVAAGKDEVLEAGIKAVK